MTSSDVQYWMRIQGMSGQTREELDRNLSKVQQMHVEASRLVADGFTLMANHVYTTSEGMTWVYIWLVKVPAKQFEKSITFNLTDEGRDLLLKALKDDKGTL